MKARERGLSYLFVRLDVSARYAALAWRRLAWTASQNILLFFSPALFSSVKKRALKIYATKTSVSINQRRDKSRTLDKSKTIGVRVEILGVSILDRTVENYAEEKFEIFAETKIKREIRIYECAGCNRRIPLIITRGEMLVWQCAFF